MNPIEEANAKLLDSLTGTERVRMSMTGRLYVEGGITRFFKETVSNAAPYDARAQEVAVNYARKKITDVTKTPEEYQKLVGRLSSALLLDANQKKQISDAWYEKRFEVLKQELGDEVAEATLVIEMNQDPNISQKIEPEKTSIGESGAYFLKDRQGRKIGVFKPFDEEHLMPNSPKEIEVPAEGERLMRKGHVTGTSYRKEAAAYALDVGNFAGVPKTNIISIPFKESVRSTKIVQKMGSFQRFAQGRELGKLTMDVVKEIPVQELQKVAIFDMLGGNSDRLLVNALYDTNSSVLTPIDHGLMFMDNYDWVDGEVRNNEDHYGWFNYAQLDEPFTDSSEIWILTYPEDNIDKLDISDGAKRECKLRLLFLKEGVKRGFTPNELARFFWEPVSGGVRSAMDYVVRDTVKQFKDEGLDLKDETLFYGQFVKNLRIALDKFKEGKDESKRT